MATPAFEIDGDLEPEDWQNEEEELGPGRRTPLIGSLMDGRCWTFPRWPTWEQDSDDEDTIFATTNEVKGYIAGRAVPVKPMDLPWKMQHINDARGAIVSLTWKKPVPFDNGRTQRTIWFTENTYGSQEAALTAAWTYFLDRRNPRKGEVPASGKGPLKETRGRDGLFYHGGEKSHLCVPTAAEGARDGPSCEGDDLEPMDRDAGSA